ncbi:Os01g0172900 [Oryza sativa Japonica Group]|uniref:Os01g0172900 protein n=1 Tax=Oryza sativa subsp. japonica TaxID=39947 RepID=A0A0P0UYP2_ORYSJ|nr:hypothetical protein EE612_000524 [Oryza sativa]BAS70642.1 Os01g0172900 [Oryza sativa Japonica Group]
MVQVAGDEEEDDDNGPDQHQDSCLVSSSHSHSSLANYGSKSPETRKKMATIPEGGSLIMEGDIPAQKRPLYNVLDFNATGDGNTDDTKAFLAAWEETCNNEGWPILIIPGGRTFLLKQIKFNGSCKSPIKIQMDGNIVAPNYIWASEADNLITFYSVNNLTLDGNGQIDGKGAIWWTCYTEKGGMGQATGFIFENINMTAVESPIIIDQFYCPQGNCPLKDGGVAISDARFINIRGTSSEQEAIKILCSQSVHCQGIYLSNINLSWENHTALANATILNANGTVEGSVVPKVVFS